MVFDWSSLFSLVPFEPSRQALPGQRSLNIIPESWKPVSHWKVVFDGCSWFSLVPFEPSLQVIVYLSDLDLNYHNKVWLLMHSQNYIFLVYQLLISCEDLPWPPNESKFENKTVLDLFLAAVNIPLKGSLSTARVWLEEIFGLVCAT